jgi:mannose-6-phosphate isomerase-like protein (cupin superfamily)
MLIGMVVVPAHAQRRGGGRATIAILVTDPSGAAIIDVRVTMIGPINREARTERGRIVFEDIPSGTYRLRFERDGYVPLEREVLARGGPVTDVKVTLTRAARPFSPMAPVPPLPAAAIGEPRALNLPLFIEKNFIGRAAGKTSPLACVIGGSASLLQLREPLAEHAHADTDEFLYVIAGEGSAHVARTQETPMRAGIFVIIPRGVLHTVDVSSRTPLVILSIKAGDRCSQVTQ